MAILIEAQVSETKVLSDYEIECDEPMPGTPGFGISERYYFDDFEF